VQDTLQSIAEVAATLVGFAALFRAFTRESVADGHSESRLRVIIEQGLVVVLLCFLPAWALSFEWSEESAYRVIATAAALWLLRWLYICYSLWNVESQTPVAFRIAVALNLMAFLAFAASASDPVGKVEPLYLTGLLTILIHVGWTFLFQFRAERS
jgi:hypothetical protein